MTSYTDIYSYFFTHENPLFVSLLLIVVVIIIVVAIFSKIVFPLKIKIEVNRKKHILEKSELLNQFVELDPDPILRIDSSGIIIQTNNVAHEVFNSLKLQGNNIKVILPSVEVRENDYKNPFTQEIEGRIYSVNIKRGEGLIYANVYLHDITKQINYETDLKNYQIKLQILTEKLDKELEGFKESVSSELHNDIGQALLALTLKFPQKEKFSEEELISDIKTIYQKVRNISHQIKPLKVNALGFRFALQTLVLNISNSSGIKGSFDFYGIEESPSCEVEIYIFSAIQEALTNIVKHSSATEFSVQVRASNSYIEAAIFDNGIGIPNECLSNHSIKSSGIGLFSMKERVLRLNGVLRIQSQPENGTNIFIQIPKKRIAV